MTVQGTRGTWAMRAEQRPAPAPIYSQAEKLQRRRNSLGVLLGGDWILHHDIAAICGPLAEQIVTAPCSARFLRAHLDDNVGHLVGPSSPSASIDDLALAVHEVVHVGVGLIREAAVQRQTTHLSVEQRARAQVVANTLAERPPLPEFNRDDAETGAWATALVDLCEPWSAALADLLGRAQTRAVSDRMIAALREVDRTAASLQRRLNRDAVMRADRAKRPAPAPTDADRARKELLQLGVTL